MVLLAARAVTLVQMRDPGAEEHDLATKGLLQLLQPLHHVGKGSIGADGGGLGGMVPQIVRSHAHHHGSIPEEKKDKKEHDK